MTEIENAAVIEKEDFGEVVVRPDGSYVITKNGHPFHVPNMGEWIKLWQQVTDYVAANPDKLSPEPLPPEPPQPSPEERQKMFTDAIQKRLDDFAKTRGYDGILSAATYATSAISQFRAEGQYCVEARDATWIKGYEILGAVLAGERPMPTIEEVFAELPALEWP